MNSEELARYRELAESGDAEAAYTLAWIYYDGLARVDEDIAESLKWVKAAADLGHLKAQTCLGWAYDPVNYIGRGRFGLTPDRDEAVKWYGLAAERGYAYAQHELGMINYWEGNMKEAFKWFTAAAEQGYITQYIVGPGFPKTVEEALARFKLEAENGDVDAVCELAEMYKDGRWVEKDKEEASKWNSLAERLYLKAAEEGDAEAQYRLGYMYRRYYGVIEDEEKSERWMMKAAENGNASAQSAMGQDNDNRSHHAEDPSIYEECAAMWFRRAAEQGNGYAQYSLGRRYEVGCGVDKDLAEAFKWYIRSYENGHDSADKIGEMYEKGEAVPRDLSEAFKWYLQAAVDGNLRSRHKISAMYKHGIGVEKSEFEAAKWYRLAYGEYGASIFTVLFREIIPSYYNFEKNEKWRFADTFGPVLDSAPLGSENEASAPSRKSAEKDREEARYDDEIIIPPFLVSSESFPQYRANTKVKMTEIR